MRIVALKQCDAWTPVSPGETRLAGKLAIWPGVAYDLPEGTEFAPFPEITKERANRPAPKPFGIDKAIKDGLVKREKAQ